MAKKKENKVFTVVKEFRDKYSFNTVHQPGADVSHFDPERIQWLIKNGHVKESESKISEGPINNEASENENKEFQGADNEGKENLTDKDDK